MQVFNAGAANTVSLDVIAKATAVPITAGTVNFYLIALNGANAGKWFKAADATWQAAESSAGSATFKGGASWRLEIAASAWKHGVTYNLYAKETGDLNVIYTEKVIGLMVTILD